MGFRRKYFEVHNSVAHCDTVGRDVQRRVPIFACRNIEKEEKFEVIKSD